LVDAAGLSGQYIVVDVTVKAAGENLLAHPLTAHTTLVN